MSRQPIAAVLLDHATGVRPQHVHVDDNHVGVEHGVLLGVGVLKLLVLVRVLGSVDLAHVSGSVHVSHYEVLGDLEPPGVLWVTWLIVKACFSM